MSQKPAKTVSKLTPSAIRRHETDARLAAIATGIFMLSCSAAAAVTEWQATEDITQTAERYLLQQIGNSAKRTTVRAAYFDSRHRLAKCDQALEGFLRRGTEIDDRTIVGVRCSGSKPWKVYVPVDVTVTATVLVAKRTLPKGHTLTAGDLREEQRNVARLRTGYIGTMSEVIGLRVKTQLIAGTMFKPAMLEADMLIRRGQSVTLIARQGGFNISMSGTALMNGALNQRIRVENTNSGRVVEGFVRSREHVEVLVPENPDSFNARPKVSPNLADTRFSNNDS